MGKVARRFLDERWGNEDAIDTGRGVEVVEPLGYERAPELTTPSLTGRQVGRFAP